MFPQLCYRYELSSASLQQFYITFMCKIALQSHCQIITLSMTQLFGNLWIFSSINLWTFGWNRNYSEKKGFNLAKKRTNNVLPAYIYKCTLMCIEVSYYYSVNSFSRSENLMYTTLHLKVLEKDNNRKPWIKFRVLLKRKSPTQNGSFWTQQLQNISPKDCQA